MRCKTKQHALADPPQHRDLVSKVVGRPLFWALLVAALFGAPLVRGLLSGRAPNAPPSLGSFPSFAAIDDRGAPFTANNLRGHAFIANLLRVHCTEQGPLAAETMRIL